MEVIPGGIKREETAQWVLGEVQAWTQKGLVSPRQADALLRYYGVEETVLRREKRYGLLVGILLTLGAVLVGAGALSFIAANWQVMPRLARLALVFGGILAFSYTGYHLKFVKGSVKLGDALLFIGAILYGAGVFLVAQIYQISGDFPVGLWLWALGAWALAFAVRSVPSMALAHGVFLGGLLPIVYDMSRNNWFMQGDGLLWITFLYGVFLYTLGVASGEMKPLADFRRVHYNLGAAAMLGALIPMTFLEFRRYEITQIPPPPPPVLTWPALAVAALGALVALGYFGLSRRKKAPIRGFNSWELAAIAFLLALPWVSTFLARAAGHHAVPILINFVLLALIFGLIYGGLRLEDVAMVNLAIVAFTIDLICRYTEYFWLWMNKSLFFTLGGLLLIFIGARIEKARRQIVQRIRAHTTVATEEPHDS